MIEVLHVDSDLIVAVKPAGTEAQSAKGFAADMVSGLKKYLVINRLCTSKEPYIGVIHRLDKPVSGVMVYARTKKAAAALSSQLQNGKMEKIYQAVVCGKPVDNVDNFVDSLFIAFFRHCFVHIIYVTLLYNYHFNFLCALYICSPKSQAFTYILGFFIVCLFVVVFSDFSKFIFFTKCTINSNANNPTKKYATKAVNVIGITYLSTELPNTT